MQVVHNIIIIKVKNIWSGCVVCLPKYYNIAKTILRGTTSEFIVELPKFHNAHGRTLSLS